MKHKTNVIIVGVNVFGEMASTQRVKNLISPQFNNENIRFSNVIINSNIINKSLNKLKCKLYKYNIYNPISIIYYIVSSSFYVVKNFDKKSNNILYHYGYPSIETIFIIKTSKIIGYKIVFDIVENINYANSSKMSIKMKLKNWTANKFLYQISKTGSLCFGISTSLVEYIKTFTKNKIETIHLPISVDITEIQKFKNRSINSDTIKVFYGGSFGYKDGFEYILKGFEKACETNSNLKLILTGKISKQMDGIVQKLIQQSVFQNKIEFLGCLSESDYYQQMVNSDILCMCRVNSKYANFGFPFKLGEYLASENAIIATNVGDVNLYLKQNQNALLIEPESSIDICNSILILASDKELRKKLGMNSYKTVNHYFDKFMISDILFNKIELLQNVKK